jgi:hypothetical protein
VISNIKSSGYDAVQSGMNALTFRR